MVARPLRLAFVVAEKSGLNPAEPPQPGAPYVEVTLIDTANRLVGRLDHVEARDSGVAVVDFKSLGGASEGLSDEVRIQLLYYAGLVETAWGMWPMLAVSRPGRPEDPVTYTRAEAIAVRTEAIAFLDAWNADVALTDVDPGVPRCNWCEYQAICPLFRVSFPAEFNADPQSTRAHSLAAGKVRAVTGRGGRDLRVTIAQAEDLTCPAGEVTIARLPGDLEVEADDWIAVARVDRGGGDLTVRAAWNSLIDVAREG